MPGLNIRQLCTRQNTSLCGLQGLQGFQSLEVRLREGEQLSNVTRSFESEGQRVVSRRAEAEGGQLWRVVVTREV